MIVLNSSSFNKSDIVIIASKSIFKEIAESAEWVFCKVDEKPAIFDCNMQNLENAYKKDENGNFLYRDLNILAHLFNIDAITSLADIKLPYHRAYKKNSFVNEEGMKQVPDKPNTFKFENFIRIMVCNSIRAHKITNMTKYRVLL